jgi:hypothetical protein
MHRLSIFLIAAGVLAAQVVQPALTLEQKEEFLKHAKVVKTHGVKKGVTGTTRATLSDGEITHDASIQSIDEEKDKYATSHGLEINFRDCYKNHADTRTTRFYDRRADVASLDEYGKVGI